MSKYKRLLGQDAEFQDQNANIRFILHQSIFIFSLNFLE